MNPKFLLFALAITGFALSSSLLVIKPQAGALTDMSEEEVRMHKEYYGIKAECTHSGSISQGGTAFCDTIFDNEDAVLLAQQFMNNNRAPYCMPQARGEWCVINNIPYLTISCQLPLVNNYPNDGIPKQIPLPPKEGDEPTIIHDGYICHIKVHIHWRNQNKTSINPPLIPCTEEELRWPNPGENKRFDPRCSTWPTARPSKIGSNLKQSAQAPISKPAAPAQAPAQVAKSTTQTQASSEPTKKPSLLTRFNDSLMFVWNSFIQGAVELYDRII